MASRAEQEAFIEMIAPLAQKAYRELGKVYPSICIAMACVECGYGTAGSVKYHSYLGQKVGTGKTATKYWLGESFTSKTQEYYSGYVSIKSAFRAYPSAEMCIYNYYELLNTSLYKGVKAGVDYTTQMKQIKACGYMTSPTEVNSVLSIIAKWDLHTKYDTDIEVSIPTLKKGATGSFVVALQTRLAGLGYLKRSDIDGIFGKVTDEAVRAFQTDRQIDIDGIVGQITWANLLL